MSTGDSANHSCPRGIAESKLCLNNAIFNFILNSNSKITTFSWLISHLNAIRRKLIRCNLNIIHAVIFFR